MLMYLILSSDEMHFMYILYVFKPVGIKKHKQFTYKHPLCRIETQHGVTLEILSLISHFYAYMKFTAFVVCSL